MRQGCTSYSIYNCNFTFLTSVLAVRNIYNCNFTSPTPVLAVRDCNCKVLLIWWRENAV